MDASHLLRSARRRLAVSQREFAGRVGVPVGTLAARDRPVDNADLIAHLHLSLTQRLRLALDENPRISVSVRPKSTAWHDLVALARAGDVLLQPPLALAIWIPAAPPARARAH